MEISQRKQMVKYWLLFIGVFFVFNILAPVTLKAYPKLMLFKLLYIPVGILLLYIGAKFDKFVPQRSTFVIAVILAGVCVTLITTLANLDVFISNVPKNLISVLADIAVGTILIVNIKKIKAST